MSGSRRTPHPKLLDHLQGIREGWVQHRICRYCGGRVDPPRRSWCSELCVCAWNILINWNATRRFVWERDQGRCVLCGVEVPLNRKIVKNDVYVYAAEIDHIIEVVDGGTDEPENLRTLCHDCHVAKTTRAARTRKMRAVGQGELWQE